MTQPNAARTDRLLTVREAAERLGRTPKALQYQIDKGTAPKNALFMGRRVFRESDIEAAINAAFEEVA